MNDFSVTRLALILAIQAEIEGMKAENVECEQKGYTPTWNRSSFLDKAEELRRLV